MRRKDILIITAVLIIISFVAVSAIYWIINDGNIFTDVRDKVEEIANNKKEFHSNGWSTAIVDKIKDNAPIPVGFTYIEGNQDNGIIIENNDTKERYMWIPNQEVNSEEYEEVMLNINLEESTIESLDNIQKYNGFYVAIDERSVEEKFEEYIKDNSIDFETYYSLKQLGYEQYKSTYEEITESEFDLNSLIYLDIDEKTKLDNETKTNSVETHTLKLEELANINKYSEQIGKDISIKNLKALTVLGSSIKIPEKDESMSAPDISVPANWYDWSEDIIETVYNGVPIPKGFIYEDGTVETGFKIKNTDNLTFIWIPVEDIENVKEEFVNNAKTAGLNSSIIEAYKEYADNENDEYKELIKSIKEYGGFYISEAELGYDGNGIILNKYRNMMESGRRRNRI